MALSVKEKIGQFAIYSRGLLFIFEVIFNALIPNHDAGVFSPPSEEEPKVADDFFDFLFDGFRRWDAVYFLHIAEHGYVYENSLAFFPLFPMCCTVLSNTIFYPLQYVTTYSNVLLFAGIMINLFCFVESAKILYELGLKVVKNDNLAYRGALLYCVNPASVFMTAPYSEAMFAMLGLSGMLECERKNYLKASIWFGLAGFTRSNGVILIAFVAYALLRDLITDVRLSRNADFYDASLLKWIISISKHCIKRCVQGLVLGSVCILPFGLYQFVAYMLFCNNTASYRDLPRHLFEYGRERHYKMAYMGKSEWCFETVPLSYSYVQANHWDVGFLKYYEKKQIPNFILASPMLFLCLTTAYAFLSENPGYVKTLAFLPDEDEIKKKKDDATDNGNNQRTDGFYSAACFVYIVHMLALTTVAVFFMHIQVITRFIVSSCPIIFWFVASITAAGSQGEGHTAESNVNGNGVTQNIDEQIDSSILDDYYEWDNKDSFSRLIFAYFHLYFFVGTAAFANYLPWT